MWCRSTPVRCVDMGRRRNGMPAGETGRYSEPLRAVPSSDFDRALRRKPGSDRVQAHIANPQETWS